MIKPLNVYPYDPINQTPKLVTIKKINAPKSAPNTLVYMFDKKNFEHNPINITLPHVKSVKEWKPIKISVKKKLPINAGKYLIPNSAGT